MVGSHLLLDLIKSGEKVKAIHRRNSDFDAVKKVFGYESSPEEATILFNSVEWMEADITDIPSLEKAFTGIKKVYHCAALVSFDPSSNSKLRKINIKGTANVVNLSITHRVEKVCYVSSIATFDKKVGEKNITETSYWNKEEDHSMYAITKYGAEMEVWRASQEGVPVVIVNPGVIIGPGFWNSGSGLLFKRVYNGLKYHFPQVTGFVGVRDVVKVMQQLMTAPVQNEQFILVSENLPFHEVFRKVASSIGKPAPTKQLKPWMVYFGWVFEKISGFFTGGEKHLTRRQSAESLFEESFYSSKKIEQEIGFKFEYLEAVINRTGRIFKEYPG